jgi:hypothetical protein
MTNQTLIALRAEKEARELEMKDYETYFDLMERSNKIPMGFDEWRDKRK